MRRWTWTRLVAVFGVIVLVAVACANDDDAGGDDGGEEPEEIDFTAGLTGEPVKVGVVALTGVISTHETEFMPLMEEEQIPSIAHVAAQTASLTSPGVLLGTISTDIQGLRDALGSDLEGMVTTSSTTCPFDTPACEQADDAIAATVWPTRNAPRLALTSPGRLRATAGGEDEEGSAWGRNGFGGVGDGAGTPRCRLLVELWAVGDGHDCTGGHHGRRPA